MHLRDYTDADFDDVRRVLEETGLFVPEVDTRDRFKEKIEREPGSIIVAADGGRVVGCVFVTDDATTVLITRLAVHPDQQGAGVGTALLEAVEDWLAERGTRIAVAFAETADTALIDWYEQRGYESKGGYEMMWKDL